MSSGILAGADVSEFADGKTHPNTPHVAEKMTIIVYHLTVYSY